MTVASMTPATRLRLLIAVSGLSQKAYAETVLGRSERAIQYWLAGRYPIPKRVLAQLDAMPLPPLYPLPSTEIQK